ncbi:uncharacterized protein LOC132204679 [Neocloeon triangulifer]|uniref:uncharacterized protein LOC132204679 n=1 Tax=Neocloeon triangulifer TaxID=2078957 RepID=UPI00286F696C|nr:uncharacterized protein LOC132204679 [Neocloeon triangulifer]
MIVSLLILSASISLSQTAEVVPVVQGLPGEVSVVDKPKVVDTPAPQEVTNNNHNDFTHVAKVLADILASINNNNPTKKPKEETVEESSSVMTSDSPENKRGRKTVKGKLSNSKDFKKLLEKWRKRTKSSENESFEERLRRKKMMKRNKARTQDVRARAAAVSLRNAKNLKVMKDKVLVKATKETRNRERKRLHR